MSGWVKIPDNWLESNDIEELGGEAVLLHLSALAYSCRQASDGRLNRRALRHLWRVQDLEATVAQLEKAGEWEPGDDTWLLVNWRTHLLAADEIEHRRQSSRESSERYRRHKAGDHSLCERCSAVRAGDRSRDTSRQTSVTSLDSTRNDSTRLDAKQERRGETEDGADPRSARATRVPRLQVEGAPDLTDPLPGDIAVEINEHSDDHHEIIAEPVVSRDTPAASATNRSKPGTTTSPASPGSSSPTSAKASSIWSALTHARPTPTGAAGT